MGKSNIPEPIMGILIGFLLSCLLSCCSWSSSMYLAGRAVRGAARVVKDVRENTVVVPAKSVEIEESVKTEGSVKIEESVEDKKPVGDLVDVESHIIMYDKCESGGKIFAEQALHIKQQPRDEIKVPVNYMDGPENEKVQRIEVKNIILLPGSKWTVIGKKRRGKRPEHTIVTEKEHVFNKGEMQLMDVHYRSCYDTDNIINIHLKYKPIILG
jgi:hypothetical protein